MLVAGVGVSPARLPFERVARLAQETGDRRNLGLAAIGFAHRPSGMGMANPEVLLWLEAANASPCGDPAVDAPVASRLGAELAAAGPEQRARSEALLSSSRETALAFGDPFTIGRVLGDRSSSGFSARDPSGWIGVADEIIRHARAAGDLETEFRGLEARATGHLQLGDRGSLDDAVQRCRRFAGDHPFRFARVVAGGMDAMLALLDGRFADARAALDQAERDSGGAASLGLAAQISTQRFWLALEEGRLEGLPQALERAFARFPGLPALTSGLGLAHALNGDRESARRALADVLAMVPTMPYDRGRLPCLVIAAEVAYRVRRGRGRGPGARALTLRGARKRRSDRVDLHRIRVAGSGLAGRAARRARRSHGALQRRAPHARAPAQSRLGGTYARRARRDRASEDALGRRRS